MIALATRSLAHANIIPTVSSATAFELVPRHLPTLILSSSQTFRSMLSVPTPNFTIAFKFLHCLNKSSSSSSTPTMIPVASFAFSIKTSLGTGFPVSLISISYPSDSSFFAASCPYLAYPLGVTKIVLIYDLTLLSLLTQFHVIS